jgi:hypothetical protein
MIRGHLSYTPISTTLTDVTMERRIADSQQNKY